MTATAAVRAAAPVTETRPERRLIEDPPGGVVPAYGRKGGEPIDPHCVDELHTTRVERE